MFLENKTEIKKPGADRRNAVSAIFRDTQVSSPGFHREGIIMSIMGVVYYDKYTDNHRVPGWARAERYEYCEDFLSNTGAQKKGTILQRIASVLLSVF